MNYKIKHALLLLLFLGVISCTSQPQNRGEQDFSFAFLTDIHVQPELKGDEGFKLAVNKVNQLNPDFVITGGDLVMDALGVPFHRADSLYNLYQAITATLPMPVHNTLGNHEIFGLYPESGVDTTHEEYGKKMFQKRLGKLYYSFDHKGWHFMVLDGVGITGNSQYRGYIEKEQLDWIKSDLEKTGKQTPIAISVHIPLLSSFAQLSEGAMAANDEGMIVVNSKEVLELFRHYNLRLVLQGHLHFLEDILISDRVHFITGGAVCGRWWKGPVSPEVQEGFLLFHVQGENISYEYIDYGWDAVK